MEFCRDARWIDGLLSKKAEYQVERCAGDSESGRLQIPVVFSWLPLE